MLQGVKCRRNVTGAWWSLRFSCYKSVNETEEEKRAAVTLKNTIIHLRTSEVTKHSTMKFPILFFLLLLACMYPSLAQGSYENCCLKYVVGVRKAIRRNIVSYSVQETDGGCNIPAIVFKLKKSKTLCADPRQNWVKSLMQKIDEKNSIKV